MIFEIRDLFIMVIFPKGVKYLAFHRLISFLISMIFFSMFWSAIASKLLISYEIPIQSNLEVHSRFKSLKSMSSSHPPTFITLIFFCVHFQSRDGIPVLEFSKNQHALSKHFFSCF